MQESMIKMSKFYLKTESVLLIFNFVRGSTWHGYNNFTRGMKRCQESA